jgi:hypothetical protein
MRAAPDKNSGNEGSHSRHRRNQRLEVDLGGELEDAGLGRIGHLAEVALAKDGGDADEVRVVEGIEAFGAKLVYNLYKLAIQPMRGCNQMSSARS